MFANLTYEDKQAFFSLLDEYFESRPHLVGGSGGGSGSSEGITIKPAHALAAASAYSSYNNRNAPARASPHASPTSPEAPTSGAASPGGSGGVGAHKDTAVKHLNQAGGMMRSGMNKVTSNSHVSSALGKVGAGGLTNRFTPKYTPQSDGTERERTMPPPVRGTGPPAGLTSGKSFGHVDTSSGTTALKTMWRDPKSAGPPPVDTAMHPALAKAASPLPPPVRRGAPGAKQAQALYDYAGGDTSDLAVQENQIVKIVDKASDDWWMCEDDSGQQGLVPANYLKEL